MYWRNLERAPSENGIMYSLSKQALWQSEAAHVSPTVTADGVTSCSGVAQM